MKRTLVTVTLSLFSFALLTGCGGTEDENTSTWSGGAPASSAPATTSAAEPAATSKAADKPAASDASICKSVDKAAKDMVKAAITDSSPDGMKNAVAGFGKTLDKLSGQAGDSEIGAALQDLEKVVAKARTAADPASALDGPEWNKAGTTLEKECKTAGVDINFS